MYMRVNGRKDKKCYTAEINLYNSYVRFSYHISVPCIYVPNIQDAFCCTLTAKLHCVDTAITTGAYPRKRQVNKAITQKNN